MSVNLGCVLDIQDFRREYYHYFANLNLRNDEISMCLSCYIENKNTYFLHMTILYLNEHGGYTADKIYIKHGLEIIL